MVGIRFSGRLNGVELRLMKHLPQRREGKDVHYIQYSPCKFFVSQFLFDLVSRTSDPPRERFVD